jgi:potassium-transporting ATPase ATP-binding subunit
VVFSKLRHPLTRDRESPSPTPPEILGPVATLLDGSIKRASQLGRGDVVVVNAGEVIPSDGIVVEGTALVDESAITGESAPVLRESGGDRSAVIGGTRVLSSRILVLVTPAGRR